MKDETKIWLKFAEDNLNSARILLQNKLFNPALQNAQQCVEKSLKALLNENSIRLKRTHNILELKKILKENSLGIDISDDDCDFLDSIYLPSKYPIGNVLPFYKPDQEICNKSIDIAKGVFESVRLKINS